MNDTYYICTPLLPTDDILPYINMKTADDQYINEMLINEMLMAIMITTTMTLKFMIRIEILSAIRQ